MKKKTFFATAFLVLSCMSFVYGQRVDKSEKRISLTTVLSNGSTSIEKAVGNDYSFSVSTGTYQELTGATSLNNGQIWDDPEYAFPIGFDFELFDLTLDTLYIGLGLGGLVSSEIDMNFEAEYVIAPFEADLIDRGDISGVSQSPISYKLEGAAGGRILKIEWKNAGFYEDPQLIDFVNFQLWLFEGSNDVEIHMGPSSKTNASVNYEGETGPLIGLGKFDASNSYILQGDPSSPVLVDTASTLNDTPADGTIYKFQKGTTKVESAELNKQLVKVYPNPMKSSTTFQLERSLTNAKLTVFNSFGQQVFEQSNINGKTFEMNRNNLSTGIYYYELVEQNVVLSNANLVVSD